MYVFLKIGGNKSFNYRVEFKTTGFIGSCLKLEISDMALVDNNLHYILRLPVD